MLPFASFLWVTKPEEAEPTARRRIALLIDRSSWTRSLSVVCALVAGFLALPASVRAQDCEALLTYSAYVKCTIRNGAQPMRASVWVKRHLAGATLAPDHPYARRRGYMGPLSKKAPVAAPDSDETPGNPLARKPYRAERARHDEIRARAETLSRSPRMRS